MVVLSPRSKRIGELPGGGLRVMVEGGITRPGMVEVPIVVGGMVVAGIIVMIGPVGDALPGGGPVPEVEG